MGSGIEKACASSLRARSRYDAAVLHGSHRRVGAVALVLVLALGAGCRSNGGAASDAQITTGAGGAEITLGARKAELPADDIGKDVPSVTRDETARRLAYRTSSGRARIVYLVGEGLFVGPLVAPPVDFRAVPDVERVLGTLFEAAGSRRGDLVREVRREKGDSGVVRLLVEAAHVDDPAWEEARKQLSAGSEGALADALASGLERGKPPVVLRRAVSVVDLRAPARASLVAERARDLASGTDEPRAAAALLRAVIANDVQKAADIACTVLAQKPAAPDDERDSLVEAAALAVAVAGTTCPDPTGLESVLMDACKPWFRCSEGGPVAWSDTSKQDEPVCTKEQLAKAVDAELARSTRDVLEGGARPGLFALAALTAKNAVPATFMNAHARRRYALGQPSEPACDTDLDPGTPCHCDEATVRLYACKEPTSSHIHVGVCRFDVDDKKKRIANVVATPPP